MAHCLTIPFQGFTKSQQLSNWREAEDVGEIRILKHRNTESGESEVDEQPARVKSKGRYEKIDTAKLKPAPVCEFK